MPLPGPYGELGQAVLPTLARPSAHLCPWEGEARPRTGTHGPARQFLPHFPKGQEERAVSVLLQIGQDFPLTL